MSHLGGKHERIAVPQFGGWEQHKAGETNYSVVFSQARAKKKQSRSEGPLVKHNPYTELTSRHTHTHTPTPTPVFRAPSPSTFQPPVSPNNNNNIGLKRFFGCFSCSMKS